MPKCRALWSIYAVSILLRIGADASMQDTAAFEVASVKPVKPEQRRPYACGFVGGRFIGFGSLLWFVACAYEIPAARANQEILGPKWLNEELFEIQATVAPADVPRLKAVGLLMLQALLAERFKLVTHQESKERPKYALVMARQDGRLGPRLRATPSDCADWIAGGRRGPLPPITGDMPCGRQVVTPSALRGTTMTLPQLANLLSPRVERPVEDRTGLEGTFAVDLEWRLEKGPPDAGVSDSLLPSIFEAVQEQLGLKLEPIKGMSDLLVIDHVERPVPN